MKTKNPELFTSKPANQNPLWQEIPEESAETLKGGHLAVIFIVAGNPTTRRLQEEFQAELAT